MSPAGPSFERSIWASLTQSFQASPAPGGSDENYLFWLDYGEGDGEWIGLLADPTWWRAVWNTVYFTIISVTLETVLGLIVALVLNAEFAGRGASAAAILVPWAIPTIVSAKMWAWMMNDQFGILNDLFMKIGFISEPIAWTASPDTAMVAVMHGRCLEDHALHDAPDPRRPADGADGDIYRQQKIDGVHPVGPSSR
ncbi:MAG: sugar ABC transporter permease [Geminicoccaceae bacterium]